MKYSYRWLLVLALMVAVGLLGLAFNKRPWSLTALTHTPDDKHIHQVFRGNPITQRIVAKTDSIEGIAFWLDESSLVLADTPVVFHVREAGSTNDLRTMAGQLSDFSRDGKLFFMFEPLVFITGKSFDFVLEAESTSKPQAIRIRYQSDAGKYPDGSSFSQNTSKQGNLGFVLYERPTIFTIVLRWLMHPDNKAAWIALFAVAMGVYGLYARNKERNQNSDWWAETFTLITWKQWGIVTGIFITLTFVVYTPALQQFFFHDDLGLLARAIEFTESKPANLLTARPYIELDSNSKYIIPFWRPLTASLYPWITTYVFQLHSGAAFAIQLLLIGVTAGTLYFLGVVFLRNATAAFIATLAWLVHSSKIGTAFWYASSQDIFSSLFILLTVLTYARWRATSSLYFWGMSLICAALAMVSKEHAILTPFIVFAVCEVVPAFLPRKAAIAWKPAIVRVLPLVGIAGLYLILRTMALSDPLLPEVFHADTTYRFTESPERVFQNIVVYTSWTAESRLWPQSAALGEWLWQIRASGPFYPGLVLAGAFFIALLAIWKNSRQRTLLLFGCGWWFIFLGPTLLLDHEWSARWLYMPVFGVSLLLAPLVVKQKIISWGVVVLLVVYGTMHARNTELTKFYREQAAYSQEGYRQAVHQREQYQEGGVVYFVGITPHQTTSINAYLLRIAGYPSRVPIIRTDTEPAILNEGDVMIDMSNHDAYYPHYDQD